MRLLLATGLTVLLLLLGCGGDEEPAPATSPELGLSRAEEARTCLREAGFEVLGGPSSPTDRDAPDVELTLSVDGAQVFIAFYRDTRDAARFEADVRKNANRFGGLVERRDSVMIVWAEPPASDSRETIERCAFT